MRYNINEDMKRYLIGFLLLMIFLVCVGLANAQTKARPTDPALPYVVTFSQPAKGGAFTITPDGGSALKSGETVHSGKAMTIQATAFLSEVKVYKTGVATTTVAWVKVDDKTYTFTMPAYPVTVEIVLLEYTVTYAPPANGSLSLKLAEGKSSTSLTSGEKVSVGSSVQIETNPTDAKKYIPSLGYPKVCRDGGSGETVPYSKIDEKRTFVMPSFPVKVEMKYEAIPSGENRLKSVSYTVNDGQPAPLSGFTSGTLDYNITLPTGTTGTVVLTGQRMDGQTDVTASASLNATGTTTVTLKVTAEDGTSRTYTFHFVIAKPDSYIVTLASGLDGGTIAAVLADGKVVKSGDAVAGGTEVTLSNIPLKGYEFSQYTVNGTSFSGDKVTVAKQAVTISATFTKTVEIKPDDLGKPAITQPSGSDPAPALDAPVVIIPDAGALPSDTELSELRLIKDEATEENTKKVEELATTNNLEPKNMDVVEITLVKIVTTTNGVDGTETTTVTPVQPGDKVKVRIPYPAGKSQKDFNFAVIHLKSDGTTEAYTVANGNLSLQEGYMELTIASFSPFGIVWMPKSNPDPTPDPTPSTYFDVTLPSVGGVTLSESAGKHSVKEGYDFSFLLTVQEGYKQYSTPKVTLSRNNEVITPRVSDGRYVVEGVDRDITIRIEGIVKDSDTPTGDANIQSGIRIQTGKNMLLLQFDIPRQVSIFTLAGQAIHCSEATAGDNRYTLSPGLYLVCIDNKAFKVVIH